jgi:hypothetical protein
MNSDILIKDRNLLNSYDGEVIWLFGPVLALGDYNGPKRAFGDDSLPAPPPPLKLCNGRVVDSEK